MKKFFLIVLVFLSVVNLNAQLIVGTIAPIEIAGSASKRANVYSTFTNGILGGSGKMRSLGHQGKFNHPASISIENPKGFSVIIDSIDARCEHWDTNNVAFMVNLFHDGHLLNQSTIKNLKRVDRKTWRFEVRDSTMIPPGKSHLSFSYEIQNEVDFFIYVNNKIPGICYSYNDERNEFKVIELEHDVVIGSPQVKIYYTTLYE